MTREAYQRDLTLLLFTGPIILTLSWYYGNEIAVSVSKYACLDYKLCLGVAIIIVACWLIVYFTSTKYADVKMHWLHFTGCCQCCKKDQDETGVPPEGEDADDDNNEVELTVSNEYPANGTRGKRPVTSSLWWRNV